MKKKKILLPSPKKKGIFSFEETLWKRKSRRQFKKRALTLEEVSQLLWAGQGIIDYNRKTTPSAGAIYPCFLCLVNKNTKGLDPGIYRYKSQGHYLELVLEEEINTQLCRSCLNQNWIKEAGINIIIGAVFEKTINIYGKRGIRYVLMEAGHISQNIYLQAETLGLATVAVGAFEDEKIKKLLKFSVNEQPLYIMPVGKK